MSELKETKATYIPMDDYEARDYKPFYGRPCHFCDACKEYYDRLNRLGITKERFMPRCYGDRRLAMPSMEELGIDDQKVYDEMVVVNDPMKWAEVFFGWKPRWYQEEMLGCTSRYKVVRAGRRLGKALHVDTPIPTIDGWKRMGDIKPGDIVFGPDGLQRNVLGVEDEKIGHACYEVFFSDGSSLITDDEHIWKVDTKRSRKARRRAKNPQSGKILITTEEMIPNLYVGSGNKREANYSIDVCAPLDYAKQDHIVPPYVLGAWLGDGHSQGGTIYSEDIEVIEEIVRNGYSTHRISSASKGCGNADAYRIEGLTTQLNALGVTKNKTCNGEKFIPTEYLHGSIAQREELLAGLMDTDGSVVCRKSGGVEFSVCNQRLAEGFWELVKGLGYKATMRKDPAKIDGRQVGWRYRVFFTPWRPVFKLQRKLDLQKLRQLPSARQRCRYIVDVKPVENTRVRCITVDDPDGLYLVGENLISTHNTNAISIYALWYAFTHSHVKILVVAPFQSQVALIFQEMQMYIDQSVILQDSIETQRNSPPITIGFKNGSYLKGFASGKGQSQHSDQIRGQGADLIVLDEVDMMNDYDIETIMAIRASSGNCEVWASSTPRGWRKAFWDWCTKKNLRYREFHYISAEGPEWSQDQQEYFEMTTSKMGFMHEYLAEFGEEAFGVFKGSDIDEALFDYSLKDITPAQVKGPCIMGVDWNLNAGTHIVIVEWTGEMFKLVHKTVVPKSEFTQMAGVAKIKELNKLWDPRFIYVDEGYGSAQIEMLKETGLEDPGSGLYQKLKPIMMARSIEIQDKKTGEKIQRQSKQFMVELSANRVEQHQVMLPREEDTHVDIEPDDPDNSSVGIVQQMRSFRVVRESATGQPVYSQDYEHTLTALMLAIMAFQIEFGGLRRTHYPTKTAAGPEIGEKEKKTTSRSGDNEKPLSKRPILPRGESFQKKRHNEVGPDGYYRINKEAEKVVGGSAQQRRGRRGGGFGQRNHRRTGRGRAW